MKLVTAHPFSDEHGTAANGTAHQYGKAHTKNWSEQIASLDAYIFVTPNTTMRLRQQ